MKPKDRKEKEMRYRSIIAQIINIFMEQRSFDWNMDQEQSFACNNETGKIDMRRID